MTNTAKGFKIPDYTDTADIPTLIRENIEAAEKIIKELENVLAKLEETADAHKSAAVLDHPDGSVTSGKIKDRAVTSVKIGKGAVVHENMADDAVWEANLGRLSVTNDKIANNAVTSNKIEDGAVTSAKIPDNAVTENKIHDRAVTSAKIGKGAVVHENMADDAVWEANLGRLSVTNDKIANDAVTFNKIQDGAVTTAKIADGAISEGKISGGAVTHVKLAENSVWHNNIGHNAVEEYNIADGSVTTAKIADGSVTNAKLADNAVVLRNIDAEVLQKCGAAASAVLAHPCYPMNDEWLNTDTGKWELQFSLPQITIKDTVFGEISLPKQEITYSGQAEEGTQKFYLYAKYELENPIQDPDDKPLVRFSGDTPQILKKESGTPINYIEVNGNEATAVYVFLVYVTTEGYPPGPDYERTPYKGDYNWNTDTEITFLHS